MSLPLSFNRSPQSFSASAPDARADGGIRHIEMSKKAIRIERQVAGIKMHVAVPIDGYEAVVLTSAQDGEQRRYRVALVHSDPELTIELHEASDSAEILAIWRNWADFFAKPALYVETPHSAQRQLARSARPRPHRRGENLSRRRPRFLKRRHGARVGARALAL